jgi:methylated-DNA-[protein]-cysteine S-methyltransferase
MRLKSEALKERMPEILRLPTDQFETPIGEMMIAADHDGNLRAAEWTDHTERIRNVTA